MPGQTSLDISSLDPNRPVLIAGPTASGKSALALEIAAQQESVVINADALQVYGNWQVLTARPGPDETGRAPHALYGHVGANQTYSVGHWLRDVAPFLAGGARPIIVGGTGLYFTALTEGLASIPDIPDAMRSAGDALSLAQLVSDLDRETAQRIDLRNRARVQRAWEVLQVSGHGLAWWQDQTPPPTLPISEAHPIVIDAHKDWLSPRIEARFDQMLQHGAMDEVRANLQDWDPKRPSCRAIGAPELVAHLRGELSLDEARERAVIATRQYAKRQRTWFRARMAGWQRVTMI